MSTRRKSYVSKPNFQIKLTIIFMLMVTIVANLVGGMCYWLISEKFHNLVDQAPDDFAEITSSDIAQFLLPKIMLAQAVSLLIVFFLSILVTHTIAGPVYRMERVAREIGAGNLTGKTKLRPRDELKELADAFNDMAGALADKVRVLREEISACETSGNCQYDFSRAKEVLYTFELPEDDGTAINTISGKNETNSDVSDNPDELEMAESGDKVNEEQLKDSASDTETV
jgi:methyl-accepting chemotaxis protein